jgi:Uma2 family endonuclease
MPSAEDQSISPAEYLAFERDSPTRHELVNGRIYAMAGDAPAHNRITANLAGLLWSALRASPCQPNGSDQRIGIPGMGFYTYPDLSIACPPEAFDPDDPHTLVNPTVLIEVLSPSTEAYDRGAKSGHYRRIPSLQEYWLVSADRMHVERFVRRGEEWVLQEFEGGEAAVPLGLGAGIALPLLEVYARVELPERPER